MMQVEIVCQCGQKYAFDVEPVQGRMPCAVHCPACNADGTAAANLYIARSAPLPRPVTSYAAPIAARAVPPSPSTKQKGKSRLLAPALIGGVVVLLAGGLVAWNFFGPRKKNTSPSSAGLPAATAKSVAGLQSAPPPIKPGDSQAVDPGLPANLREGLILYYDFNTDPAGGKVPDRSGHGNDGLAVNVEFVKDGHQGGAARFGLNGSYITVTNKDELNPPRLTLAAWIKTSYKDRVWRRILDKKWDGGFAVSIGGLSGQDARWNGRATLELNKHFAASDALMCDGQWHHLAGTFDGAQQKLYVDGMLQKARPSWNGDVAPNAYDLTIGANRSNPDGSLGEVDASFNGMMDDVMMFNRALSADEVQALFKAQGGVLAPQPAPPAGTQGQPGAADRLKQLKALYDQGLIKQEDYDRKRQEIINSI